MSPCGPTIMISAADAETFASSPVDTMASSSTNMKLIVPTLLSFVERDAQQIDSAEELSSDAEVASIASSSGRASLMIPSSKAAESAAAKEESLTSEVPCCAQEEGQGQDKNNGKRLRFDSKIVYIDDSDDLDDDNKISNSSSEKADFPSATWWSRDDLRSFKASARSTCRKVRERRAFTTCIDVAYQIVSRSENDNNNNDGNNHQGEATKEDLLKLIRRGLTKWSKHGHSCRGLERRMSEFQFTARQRDLAKVRRAVFEVQAKQEYSRNKRKRIDSYVPTAAPTAGTSAVTAVTSDAPPRLPSSLEGEIDTNSSSSDGLSPSRTATCIRQASLARTERARLFARMLGEADAAAALNASFAN